MGIHFRKCPFHSMKLTKPNLVLDPVLDAEHLIAMHHLPTPEVPMFYLKHQFRWNAREGGIARRCAFIHLINTK